VRVALDPFVPDLPVPDRLVPDRLAVDRPVVERLVVDRLVVPVDRRAVELVPRLLLERRLVVAR
jgi:hypothetical protein